ncbi:MAG TPA: terminase [Terriglobales bacterium]|nr:terminase [Terriglobales bacterium]
MVTLGKRLDEQPSPLNLPEIAWLKCPDGQLHLTVRDHLACELLKIRDKQGYRLPLAANRAQREFSRTCKLRNIVLKARQMGITTWVAGRFFLHTITRPGTVSVQVAHDLEAAEELFRIVRRFLENLPEELRTGALRTSRANVRQIIFPHLDSEYRVETAADPNAGRGLTIRNLHCSELAYWPNDPAETLASLRAAVPPDGEVVLESTPNGAGGCFYDQWQQAAEQGYVRHFYPWWWEPSYRRDFVDVLPLSAEEEKLAQQHGLEPAQIAFRREVQAEFGGRSAQEFAEDAESCFLTSGECVFELKVIKERMAFCGKPVETRDNGHLQIWFPPVSGDKSWIIGVDPAGGGALGDFACAQVIERSTGMQCAELLGHFNPQELAGRLAELAREYGNALVAVELNNHGHAVVAHLTRGEDYWNLYDQDNRSGWLTTTHSRQHIIENLAVLLRRSPHLFFSQRLLEQCRTFVRHADGSRAAAGTHDDCVLAMAIAQEVRRKSPKSPGHL